MVKKGMDVVEKIANSETDYMDNPMQEVKILSVDIK